MTTFVPYSFSAPAGTALADDMEFSLDQAVEDLTNNSDLDLMEEDIADDDIMLDEDRPSRPLQEEIQLHDEELQDVDNVMPEVSGSPMANMPDQPDPATEAYSTDQYDERVQQMSANEGLSDFVSGEPKEDVIEDDPVDAPNGLDSDNVAVSSLLGQHPDKAEIQHDAGTGNFDESAISLGNGNAVKSKSDDPTSDAHHAENLLGSREKARPSTLNVHPVMIMYEGSEMSLFPPSGDDSLETFLLQDETLVNESINDLFKAIRLVLEGSIPEHDDLEIGLDELDLLLSEDSTHSRTTSLSQILNLHVQLYRQDGYETPEPMYINLSTKAGFGSRLRDLTAIAEAGKGISHLPTRTDTGVGDFEEQQIIPNSDTLLSNQKVTPQGDERLVKVDGEHEVEPQNEDSREASLSPEAALKEEVDREQRLTVENQEVQNGTYATTTNDGVIKERSTISDHEANGTSLQIDDDNLEEIHENDDEIGEEDLIDYEEDDETESSAAEYSSAPRQVNAKGINDEDAVEERSAEHSGNLDQNLPLGDGKSEAPEPHASLDHGQQGNDLPSMIPISVQQSDSHSVQQPSPNSIDKVVEETSSFENENVTKIEGGSRQENAEDIPANDDLRHNDEKPADRQSDSVDEPHDEQTLDHSGGDEGVETINFVPDHSTVSDVEETEHIESAEDINYDGVDGSDTQAEENDVSGSAEAVDLPSEEDINYDDDDDDFELDTLPPPLSDANHVETEVEENHLKRSHGSDAENEVQDDDSQGMFFREEHCNFPPDQLKI
ncbi:MAG: hypothetical protein M1837_005390 [Sclerophora amabilis]|nr:MAG: hypothetical protein M1837_005390 [Sclerophora amabilis]